MAADPTTSAPATALDPGPETAPDATAVLPYVTDTWGDLVIYRCPACGYNTFRPDLIEAHQLTCQALARTREQPREPGASVAEAAPPDVASDTAAATPPSEEV